MCTYIHIFNDLTSTREISAYMTLYIVIRSTSSRFCIALLLPAWQSDDMGRVAKAAKIMERMVNQNTYDDISQGLSPLTTSQL